MDERVGMISTVLCESEVELDLEIAPHVELAARIDRIAKAAQRRRLSPRHYRVVYWLAMKLKSAVP